MRLYGYRRLYNYGSSPYLGVFPLETHKSWVVYLFSEVSSDEKARLAGLFTNPRLSTTPANYPRFSR